MVNNEITEIEDIDTTMIMMKTENDVLAFIDNCSQCCYQHNQREKVFGSKGMSSFGNNFQSNITCSTKKYGVSDEVALFSLLERYMDAYKKEIKYFIRG